MGKHEVCQCCTVVCGCSAGVGLCQPLMWDVCQQMNAFLVPSAAALAWMHHSGCCYKAKWVWWRDTTESRDYLWKSDDLQDNSGPLIFFYWECDVGPGEKTSQLGRVLWCVQVLHYSPINGNDQLLYAFGNIQKYKENWHRYITHITTPWQYSKGKRACTIQQSHSLRQRVGTITSKIKKLSNEYSAINIFLC